MTRTVVVEQEYNPDIMDASKVNVLPKVEEPAVVKKKAEYAVTPIAATTIPMGVMTPYLVTKMQPNATPGYVRAGYGNYGNLDVFANYLFRLSDKDKLNVRFQMDGMDGELDMPDEELTWDAYYYRTRANIGYTHQFSRIDFDLAANFGLSNFNLAPREPGKQKLTEGDFHIGLRSTDESYPLQFKAETNLMMYNRQNNNTPLFADALGETQIHTKGVVSGAISDEQTINIGADLRNIFYTKDLKAADLPVYEDRTTLTLTPYYELNSDNWRLHIGANVDLSFGAGKNFRVSPDVTAQYVFSDSYVLYAQATGGKMVNDLRRLETLSPYLLPLTTVYDTYEQVNAAIGFKASPCAGLWLNLYGGYQDLKDDAFQIQQEGEAVAEGTTTRYQFLNLGFTGSSNLYAGLKVNYDYKDIFSFAIDGTYRNWDADEAYALLLKPAYELKTDVTLRPVRGLDIQFGYYYAGREEVTDFGKMSAINNLYAGASYNFFRGVSVYARINNLLNQEYQYYLGYPTEGFNFVGGLSFRF